MEGSLLYGTLRTGPGLTDDVGREAVIGRYTQVCCRTARNLLCASPSADRTGVCPAFPSPGPAPSNSPETLRGTQYGAGLERVFSKSRQAWVLSYAICPVAGRALHVVSAGFSSVPLCRVHRLPVRFVS